MSYARNDGPVRAVVWIAAAILAYSVFVIVRPFLIPIGWAAVIAIVFHPLYSRFGRRWGGDRAAAVTTMLVTIVVIAPLCMIATAFVNETLDAVRDLQNAVANGRFAWIERASRRLLRIVPAMNQRDVVATALDALQRGALALVGYSGAFVRNIVTFMVELVLALFASFFLLRDSSAIMTLVRSLVPLDDVARDRLLAETGDLIAVSVRSSIVVAGLQGLLGGCVFAAVGIDAPVFWGA